MTIRYISCTVRKLLCTFRVIVHFLSLNIQIEIFLQTINEQIETNRKKRRKAAKSLLVFSIWATQFRSSVGTYSVRLNFFFVFFVRETITGFGGGMSTMCIVRILKTVTCISYIKTIRNITGKLHHLL